jgi:formylglycine-generating enzyme required for sulfatase activity
MMDLFRSGGVFMWPVLISGILMVAAGFRAMVRCRIDSGGDGRASTDAALFWGVFATVLGALGTLGGLAQMGRAVERAGETTPELVAWGVGVALIPVLFGLALLLLGVVLWSAFRLVSGRSAAGTVLPVVLFLGGCGADGSEGARAGEAAVVRDSAGVTVVETRGPDRPLSLTATPLATLVPPDSALTAVPWGIAADPVSGLIHVADWTGARIISFDGAGRYLRTLGREGSGPGEFRSPTALALEADGTLVVWDAGRAVLSRWSPAGAHLSEDRPPVDYWGPGFAVGPGSLVTVTSARPSGTVLEQRLVRHTPDGQVVLHSVPLEMVVMRLCGTMPAPRVLSPSVWWTSRGDTVFVLNGPGYRIDAHVGGHRVSSFRRPIEAVRVTERMAVAAVASGPGPFAGFLRACGVTAADVVGAVGYEEAVSPVMGLAADPRGRLWVARTTDGLQPAAIDLLAPTGEYLGTLELAALPVGFPSDSTFLALRIEPTGLPTITLYRLDGDVGQAGGAAAREFRDCVECPVMVELPPGRFIMGAADGEMPAARIPAMPEWKEAAAMPRVEVEIAYPLAMGKHEVSFAEWDRCVEAGGCIHRPGDAGWGRGDRPVIMISRSDAEEFAVWLSALTGHVYRLPSEAEWEYAARAGTTTARWWGAEVDPSYAACDGCGSHWDKRSTAPVGSFPANPFGLHDMLSNVSEWVADCWHDTLEGMPTDGSARVETSPWWRDGRCIRPVIRGGAYSYYPWAIWAANRGYWWPGPWTDRDSDSRGFRVARPLSANARSTQPPPA